VTSTSELLLRHDQKRARSRQKALGMSEIGGCERRAGYRLAGFAPTNPGGSVQAMLGTAIHDVVAAEMAEVAEPGDLVEYEVSFAGVLGHLDRYEAATQTVVDVKTTSSRWLEHIKLHGPDENHRWQIHLYGAALAVEGTSVKRVRIDYLARDTAEEWTWDATFQVQEVRAALAWLDLVRKSDVEMLPRRYTPESGMCRSCPYLDACWPIPAEASRGRMSVLFADDPDAGRWAAELWQAREDRKAAAEREKRARGALEAVRPGDGVGRVACGPYTVDFRVNGVYFVAGSDPIPALGYHEGDS
jgi:hypothetical protein